MSENPGNESVDQDGELVPELFERLGAVVANQVSVNPVLLPGKTETKNNFAGFFKTVVRNSTTGKVVLDTLMPFEVTLTVVASMASLMATHIARLKAKGVIIDTQMMFRADMLREIARGQVALAKIASDALVLFEDDSDLEGAYSKEHPDAAAPTAGTSQD